MNLYFGSPCEQLTSSNYFTEQDVANQVLEHANTLQTKIDAYSILNSIVLGDCNLNDAATLLNAIIGLLKSLGEDIPDEDIAKNDVANHVSETMKIFELESDDTLLRMHSNKSTEHVAVVQAYNVLANLAYLSAQQLYPYYVSRWARFCLTHRVASKYVPGKLNALL